jgi:hypothetical protein
VLAQMPAAARAVLGMEGPRTYAVLGQNSAELRPTGGFIGSLGLVTLKRLESYWVTAGGILVQHVSPVMSPVCLFEIRAHHRIVLQSIDAESCLKRVVKARGRSKPDAELFDNVNPLPGDVLENPVWNATHNSQRLRDEILHAAQCNFSLGFWCGDLVLSTFHITLESLVACL